MRPTHDTVTTAFVDADGVRYAYRRFGIEGGVPVLFFQHLRGTMDYWDPAVTDGLAASRPVVLFDNAGVGSSGGSPAETFAEAADTAARFADAAGLDVVDVLGFSMGGYAAQAFAHRHPHRVRKLVLAGTGPRAGSGEGRAPDMVEVAGRHDVPSLEGFLYLFFAPTPTSQAAGRAFWARRHRRTAEPDAPSSRALFAAQLRAAQEWSTGTQDYLREITASTLVVNGDADVMVPTVNSWTLAAAIPDATLIVYPDSGHGALFQYPELFVAHTTLHLDR